ncbi:MAG: cation acetate symporter [Porticoccaceae bacterium]|jgi:cation/acetate symporter|nr:cation acetate symporter [Porticoccaceae bacterium]HLS98267.1 cation acetate symporter [Porticoccaceae bacterium]
MISASIGYFFVTIAVTLGITFWAARRNTGKASFYAAEGKIGGTQNGFAIAGDYMSAGTILGIVGLYTLVGVDVSLYFIAPLGGLCLGLAILVGPLRRMGKYTLGDVVQSRLQNPRTRVVLGACTITISLINLVAQMVGAGGLISIVFGLEFNLAVITVGTLMTVYVAFGGMLAATWVQIIKAAILVGAVVLLSLLCIIKAGGLGEIYTLGDRPQASGRSLYEFGALNHGLFSSISLAVASVAGMMSMPHLLIRFFTVPDETQAKRSLLVGTLLIGGTMGLVFLVVSPASLAWVTGNPAYQDASGAVSGGSNMITLHLARELGGELFFGVMSAVAFSTILAVVAGLTVAISSATSHDIFAALRRGAPMSDRLEVALFRLAALVTSAAAVALAILFQHENLTFLIVMGLNVAASTTFPLLMLAIYWRGLTAAGAVAAGVMGLVASVGLIVLSPAFWVKVLGNPEAVFPSDYPALVSMPLAFAAAWLVSRLGRARQPAESY